MIANQKSVARMLRKVAEQIDNNKCGLEDDELITIGQLVAHRKINIEQTCLHFGISRATLNRWQQCGKLPPFRKDAGGKDYLYLDEAEECVEKYENPS